MLIGIKSVVAQYVIMLVLSLYCFGYGGMTEKAVEIVCRSGLVQVEMMEEVDGHDTFCT